MRAKCFFRPCASIAPSLVSRVESGSEKTTIENRQKGNEVTELAEITNDGMNRKGMGNDERLPVGGEKLGGEQRAIVESRKNAIGHKRKAERTEECLHFEKHPATPRSHVSVE